MSFYRSPEPPIQTLARDKVIHVIASATVVLLDMLGTPRSFSWLQSATSPLDVALKKHTLGPIQTA